MDGMNEVKELCTAQGLKEIYTQGSQLSFDATQQFILAFAFGLVLAPWSWGWVVLIASILIFEVGYFLWCSWSGNCADVLLRVGLFYCKIFGFIVGRTVSQTPVMRTGIQWRSNYALAKELEKLSEEEKHKRKCQVWAQRVLPF